MGALKMKEYPHPDKRAREKYDYLVGIDGHKEDLLHALRSILDQKGWSKWLKKHHPKGLPYMENVSANDSLVILSGDVGCGKTELAHAIGTPLSDLMDGSTIMLFETPSDVRGNGHVGELSTRITAAFEFAKSNVNDKKFGILLIDEGDDLATSRDQSQAHHEDRAGVNVLIKEIDEIQRAKIPLAVILITNRPKSIDPAVLRRAAVHLEFKRPEKEVVRILLHKVFEGSGLDDASINRIAKKCKEKEIPYNFSDITKRIGKQSIVHAWRKDVPITEELIIDVIAKTEPSPLILTGIKL